MAEGVLAALEKEYRPLLAPKLLAEAKAAQVVWARVKGYPAWPAQVLTEAAALRRKDLGQERHSKGNSVPVMFFGTVEVAWVKDADVVDFKEGLYQGFFDRKTKPFKLALEQVCEYLALDRKRKAPPKWWCKPPSNGLDEQSDAPSLKPASASGSGAAKGAAPRQDAPKASRQRNAVPETESASTSDEDDASGSHGGGGKGPSKAASGKDGRQAKDTAPPVVSVKPRASSAGRAARDNGSTAASTNTAAQGQAKKPPPAPQTVPKRVLKEPAEPARDAREGRSGATAATSDVKMAPTSQASQQQQRVRSSAGASLPSGKETDSAQPLRKRIKVEPTLATAVGPAAGSASSLPPPPPAAAKRTRSAGEDVGELEAATVSEVDILKLPAEIRRLAGIRLPALPKKPGTKVEESPREHLLVKAEHGVAAVAVNTHAGTGKLDNAAGEGTGRTLRAARSGRANSHTIRPGQLDGGQGKTGPAKRTRRGQSSSGEESQFAGSSDEDEEAQSSGEEAESDAAASSSSGSSSDESSDASEEESEDGTARRGAVAAATRQQTARTRAQSQPPPARDRKGEKQRRLARLSAPEPANRRTSARLVPKASAAAPSRKADTEDSEAADSADESEGGEGEDERSSSGAEASSSSSDESDSEEEEEEQGVPAAKESKGSGDQGIKHRLRNRSSQATRSQAQLNPGSAAGKVSTGPSSRAPSREGSQPPEQRAKAAGSRAGTDVEATDDDNKQRCGSSVIAAPPIKVIPLELRRLQTSPSAGPPAVNTSEPRTLRDRSSPSRRAVGSTGVTPTPTATAATTTGTKRCDKRGSEDGSGASMSPAVQRTRSPEHRRDGQKVGATADAKVSPKAHRAQALEGRSSKASSLAGSASPPPAPVPGAVPVRKKPPSLGVPSTARSAGQAGARHLPAITPARAVLRSLASTGDAQQPSTQPASGCAGSSAAGTLLASIAVCVPKKPSTGPPTRRLVEPGLDAPVSSTDLPEMASLDCEADAKRASSPDVATAETGAAGDGDGVIPRSPDAASLGGSRPESQVEEAQYIQLGEQAIEQQVEQRSPPPHVQETDEMVVDEVFGGDVDEGTGHAAGHSVSYGAGQDSPTPEVPPVSVELQQGPGEAAMSRVEAMEVEEQSPEQSRQQVVTQPESMEPIALHPQAAEEIDLKPEPDAELTTEQQEQLDPHPSSVNQQGLTNASHEPEPVEQAPGLAPRNSVAYQGVLDPMDQSPARTPSAPEKLQQAAMEPEASALAPQARSGPGSPVHEEVLLTEEQLPDQAEATAEHDGRTEPTGVERHIDCGSSGGGPVCTVLDTTVHAAEATCEVPSMRSPAHAAAGQSLDGQAACAGVSAMPPCVGSRASSDGGGGEEVPPAGVSGASCSAPIWGEDEDAAARARAQELEELGEVAAALAGLSRQPDVSLLRSASQPLHSQLPAAAPLDPLVELAHCRGLGRGIGNRARQSAHGSSALSHFRWPQPEPLLPLREQPFVLPRDWLVARPPRYEPVKRNAWLSRSKPKRLPKDEISICACRAPPFAAPGELQRMGCGAGCLNRLSSILCDSKVCPCGELCSNRSLHLLRQPKTEVFLTENRGWGVRAMEPLSKGAFIIEYAGEVIDERELGRRMEHARMNGEPHFYIMELSAGLYIDARRKGNIARLINSSCDPNCETQKWHDASTGEVRVGIFASRDIPPGEELVYDYFFSAYGALKQSAASFVCMCGSKNCRGTMDLHPEKRRDLGRRLEVFWDADGQYYRAVVVAYHPTSKKHTVMYEDGGTEKLCLDEVPHRWLDDEQPRTSPQKPEAAHGDGLGALETAATEPEPPAQPHAQRSQLDLQMPELAQVRHQAAVPPAEPADVPAEGTERGRCVPIPMVASQAPPRPIVPIDQRCLLPPLGATPTEASTTHSHEQLGKHGRADTDLHLPLKKRQRMMQQLSQPAQHYAPSETSPHSNVLGPHAGALEGPSDRAQSQISAGSAGGAGVQASGPYRHSGGGADSGLAEPNGLSGRCSLRHEVSATGSGRVSSVMADDDDPNEDLDSLLEAAEAVAALRTAPISNAPSLNTAQDTVLPLQPRHIRSGSVPSAGGGTVAMVQTSKVASPRHLVAVHRAGPPNGLPPHGGSRINGSMTAHPSSSSSGFIPYQAGSSKQHASGCGTAHTAPTMHDGGYGGPSEPQHQRHLSNGRNARLNGDQECMTGPAAGGVVKNGNGYGVQSGGDVNREDLLWKLVGIEKPKDLLPLFSGGCGKSRNGDDPKGSRAGGESWIAPSHPYGKLLRALEASELLAQADQARLNAQHLHLQQQQQQRTQLMTQGLAHSQLHPPVHQSNQQQVPPPPRPQEQQQLAGPSSGPTAVAAEALALSAWQQLAQQQAGQQQPPQQQQQHATAHGVSYMAHGLDTSSVAALLQQQQVAAAAAAVAASTGQLHSLQTLQSHAAHAAAVAETAGGGAAGALTGHHGMQLPLATAAATAVPHWQQPAHGQPGSIIQDLIQMYVAQHAAGSHPMLAMPGTTTVGGGRS